MSAFFLDILGIFIISFFIVSFTVAIIFRNDLKLAFKEYKVELDLKKQKEKLS